MTIVTVLRNALEPFSFIFRTECRELNVLTNTVHWFGTKGMVSSTSIFSHGAILFFPVESILTVGWTDLISLKAGIDETVKWITDYRLENLPPSYIHKIEQGPPAAALLSAGRRLSETPF